MTGECESLNSILNRLTNRIAQICENSAVIEGSIDFGRGRLAPGFCGSAFEEVVQNGGIELIDSIRAKRHNFGYAYRFANNCRIIFAKTIIYRFVNSFANSKGISD